MTSASTIALPVSPTSGLTRTLRRWRWSLRRRLCPGGQLVLPFDMGLKLVVRPIDRLARAIYLDGYSDTEHARLLLRFLKPGMTYFDVGAHLGQFTLLGGRIVGPAGQVHAFEAASDTFALLEQSVALNKMSQVRIRHAAIFDEPGTVKLNVCVPGKGEFNSVSKPLRPDDQVVGFEEVAAITLDDYVREAGLTKVDLIKIDVNGPELQVLRGARQLLAMPGWRMVVIEFNDHTTAPLGYDTRALRAEIESHGYKVFRFDEATGELTPEPRHERYEDTVNLVAVKDA